MKRNLLLIYAGMGVFSILIWLLSPEVVSDGKIPLTWLSWNGPERLRQVNEFNKKYPKYKLSIDPDNGGITKVVVQCSANLGGDIIDFVDQSNIQTYTGAGILLDLTEHAQKMGFGLDTIPKSIHPSVRLKTLDESGNIIYRQYSYPLNIYHLYIIYNKNIFDKYRIPYPPKDLTWSEYIKIARELTIYKNKGDTIPAIFGARGVEPVIIIWEKNGRIMNKDGTRCLVNSKEVIDALCFYHDLIYKYKVEPTATVAAGVTTSNGQKSNYSWLAEEKLAMGFGSRWYLMMMRHYFRNRKKEIAEWTKNHPGQKYPGQKPYRFGTCQVPRFKNGSRYTICGGRCAGINAFSPHAQDALNFLKYAAGVNYSKQINETADCKAPNKKFHQKKFLYSREFAEEEKEIHDMAIDSIKYGRMEELSPFIDNTIVARETKDLYEKIRANKYLNRADIKELTDYTAKVINQKIAENIRKNKNLQIFYKRVLADGGEKALYIKKGEF